MSATAREPSAPPHHANLPRRGAAGKGKYARAHKRHKKPAGNPAGEEGASVSRSGLRRAGEALAAAMHHHAEQRGGAGKRGVGGGLRDGGDGS